MIMGLIRRPRIGAVPLAAAVMLAAPGDAHLVAQHPSGTPPLPLAQAVRRALDHDPGVRAAAAGSDAARAAVGEARARWFPTVAITGAAMQYQEPMVAIPIHGFEPGQTPPFDETLFQAGVKLHYTLFDGGTRGARVRSARARADAAGAALDEAAQGLVARVVRTYVSVLSARQVLDAHDRRLTALASELERVRQRREVGRAADVEVLRIEAAAASARADRVQAAVGLNMAELELARLVGAHPEETRAERLMRVTAADTVLPTREALIARARDVSPALARARREQTAAQATRAVATSARWPTLELVGAYVDRGGLDTEHALEWNVGVQLSYPIFTGGAIRKAIARADAEGHAAAARVRGVEQQLGREVDRATSAIEEARARVTALETAVSRFAEVVRIEVLRLDAGTGTQTDYLDAEADLLAAQAALAEARHGAIAARVELARVTGTLDLAWVEQHVEMER